MDVCQPIEVLEENTLGKLICGEVMATGVPYDMLKEVGTSISKVPDDFHPHRQIRKVFDARVQMLESPESLVDWGMAEALAFGTLVAEGNHVRVSGQVCCFLEQHSLSIMTHDS
jgi:2-oxoglutarate dehydrogenase complex dehydrogenase (E1) component-like enzyme